MGRVLLRLPLILAVVLLASIALAAATPTEKLLTTADFEKTVGMKGVGFVARGTQSGAGGDLNFATADGKLIVMVQIVSVNQFAGYKPFSKAPIAGLGEGAFQGSNLPAFIKDPPNNLVVFRKGASCVAFTLFPTEPMGRKFLLTIDQTIALAKLVASRL